MSSDLNRTALITCAREIMTAPAGRDVISILLHHVFFLFFFNHSRTHRLYDPLTEI